MGERAADQDSGSVKVAVRGESREATSLKKLYHQRQISYGTFIPFFAIDSEYLSSLLIGKDYVRELDEATSVGSNHAVLPPELLSQGRDSGESGKSSSDSSPVPSPFNSINAQCKLCFLSECDLQVRKLFAFMDLHLSKVETDLRTFVRKPKLDSSCDIDGEETKEDVTEKTSLLDSGIEPDQMRTSIGILRRLKEVLISLKESLNSSFAYLDELVGLYDESSESSKGRDFLQSKVGRRSEFNSRISSCRSVVDSELQTYEREHEIHIDGLGRVRKESKITVDVRQTPISCFTYLFALLFILLWAAIVYLYYYGHSPQWTVFLRLTRGPLLVVLFVYLLGIDMKVWANTKIDYVTIFDYPPKGAPTPNFYFKIAGMFTVLFSIMVAILITIIPLHFHIIQIFPIVMWLLLLGFLFNPLDVYLRRGRIAFMFVIVRVLLAPFHYVYFGDFWFADQLNSAIAILLDLEYLACYAVNGDTWTGEVNEKTCTSSANGIRPIVSCLPALWRLLQCLRSYYDTKKVAHLVNAGKYATTFPVVMFSALFAAKLPVGFSFLHLSFDDVGWIIICWFFSSFIHAVYTFAWDINRDWGLLQLSRGTLLRPKTLYRSRCLYYLAMLADLILRFTWAVKLSLAIVWHVNSDMIYTVLVVGEIVRRFIWNFFRVEFEQVCRMRDYK